MKSTGQIELVDGYKFVWSLVNGEINGYVERPKGGAAKGTGGWFRTADPHKAADIAQDNLMYKDLTK